MILVMNTEKIGMVDDENGQTGLSHSEMIHKTKVVDFYNPPLPRILIHTIHGRTPLLFPNAFVMPWSCLRTENKYT